ncbi:MAG: hypothetical protein QW478_00840 [Candidatus Micrarchaeaceae archaeon]
MASKLLLNRKIIIHLCKLDDKHKSKSLDSVTKGGGYKDIYGTYLV